MRYLALVFVIVILASCRKDESIGDQRIIVGDSSGMMVIQHDSVLQGPYYWNLTWYAGPEDQMLFNVDGDGMNDFIFYSYVDTFPDFNGDPEILYSVRVKAVNDQFQIAAIPESGLRYQLDSIHYDYFGTYPRKIIKTNYYCNEVPGAIEPSWTPFDDNVAHAFSAGEYVFEGENWFEDSDYHLSLYRNAYEQMYCNFSSGGDSLICHYEIFPEMCTSIDHDNNFYLVFKKQVGSFVNYGWIEMRISDNNKLEIFKSAIQL